MYWPAAATATDVIKSTNVLIALRWVAIAWRKVQSTTIQICFRRAGILSTDLDVQTLCEDKDPFQDIDIQVGMSSLISCSMGTLSHCSVDEYIDMTIRFLFVWKLMDKIGMRAG